MSNTDPRHLIQYTGNDEVRQDFSIVLVGREVGGTTTASSESSDVQWIEVPRVGELQMDRSMRMRIAHYERYRASGGEQHLG